MNLEILHDNSQLPRNMFNRSSETNLPSASRFPNVNVIPNLIGLKKTSIDCTQKKNTHQFPFSKYPVSIDGYIFFSWELTKFSLKREGAQMWTSHQVDGLSTNISKSAPDFAYSSISPLASLSSTHTLILLMLWFHFKIYNNHQGFFSMPLDHNTVFLESPPTSTCHRSKSL